MRGRKRERKEKLETKKIKTLEERETQFCNGVLAYKEMRLTKIAYPVM